MANREIKTKLTLDGERQFKQAMSEAADALKTLDAEQKLAKAQFEATGDAETYATERTRILKEQIAQQEQAVEAAKAALEQMKANGVDPNSRAFQTWQRKVYNAETRLMNLNTELDNAEQPLSDMAEGLDEGKDSAENFGDAVDSINKNISFQAVIDAADAVREKIAQIAGSIIRLAKGAWDVMQGGADWADELATRAQVDMMPVEMLQAWDYAARFIDVDSDTIIKARSKMIGQMDISNKDAMVAFNELGVAVKYNNGQWRDANTVFFETIDALGRVDNETQREMYAQQLFGRSARELMPLINAGSDAFNEWADHAPIVSEEDINKLTAADDAFEQLDAELDVAKYEALAALAPAFETIASGMTTVVQKFNEFVQSEEGQKALEGIGTAIESIFNAFTEDVDFEDLLGRVQKAIEGVTGALDWVIKDNNSDKVVKAIEAIAGAWGLLTLGSAALKVGKVVTGLKGLLHGAGGAAAAGGSDAGNAAAAAGGGSIWGGIKGAATALSAKIAPALSVASGPLTGIGLGIAGGIWMDQAQVEREFGDYNRMMEGLPAIEEQIAGGNEYVQQLGELFAGLMPENGDFDTDTTRKSFEYVTAHRGELESALGDLSQYGWNDDWVTDNWGINQIDIASSVGQMMVALQEQMEQAGTDSADGLAQGLGDNAAAVTGAVQGLADDVKTTFTSALGIQSPSTVMAGYGENIAQGLANGMYSRAPAVAAAASYLAALARSAVVLGLGIHSPSTVMAEMGGFTAQGFAEGIADNIWRVNDAMGAMIAATSRQPEYGRAGAGGRADMGGSGEMRAYIVMDKEIVGEMVAPAVNGWMGAQIMEAR